MTALAGLWCFDGRPDAAQDCAKMLASQRLYGPDACNQWADREIALGRQLKRLLPEDAFDRQPLHGGEGRYVLVADVRLDNRGELEKLLQISSQQASRSSDAAILLAAIERWGERCVEKLIGDYAFALWDKSARKLLLARDPLGQRPLHYHRGKSFFAIASMPKGLHALDTVPYELNEDGIVESFYPMPETCTHTYFRGVERVLPGHIVCVSRNGLSMQRHWEPKIRQLGLKGPEDYCSALREVLDQSVSCRLRGAKDLVGVELSGGLDSSAVASTMARLLAPENGRVLGFTAVPRKGYGGPVPPGRFADEGPHAAATAELYPNIEHVLVHSEGKSPFDILHRYFYLFDGPTSILSNSVWGNELLCAAQDRKLTVLLNGMCGNMGLSYDGKELLSELFRGGRWFRLWREVNAQVRSHTMGWRGALAHALGPSCPLPLWIWIHRLFSRKVLDASMYSPINPKRVAEQKLRQRSRDYGLDFYVRPWKDGREKRLHFLRRFDTGGSNKGILGGWGIDYRDPTSDVRLLEFCLSVPTEQFLYNGEPRSLARRALSDRLPKVVLEEARGGLQSADWHETMTADRERISEELERLSRCDAAARILDLPRMRKLFDEWPQNGWDEEEVIRSYRYVLSAAITNGYFVRRATGSNA